MVIWTDRAGVAGRIQAILGNRHLSVDEAADELRFDSAEVRSALKGSRR